MISIRTIRNNPEQVTKGWADKNVPEGTTGKLLKIDKNLRAALARAETLKNRRNIISKEIGQLKQSGASAEQAIQEMGQLSGEIKTLDSTVQNLKADLENRLLALPNLPHTSVPVGADASGNVLVCDVGKPKLFDFSLMDHVQLLESLHMADFKAAVRISGRGFPLFTGPGARLERALIAFMLDLHTREHGYLEIMPPYLVNRSSALTTGQLPKLEEDMYLIQEDDLFLIPTAEVPLTNIYRDTVLAEADLPKRFTAHSACFRRESGTYGKETRGILRVHQFNKVELVKFVHPDGSYEELETLRADAEKVLQLLDLPYRVLELCTGDLSFAAAKCYDLELWAPGSGKWLEVSSCSNFEDFQARRGQIRFRRSDTGKLDFVHTLNGSGVATPRLMVALLENYQMADGSVSIPQVLVPFFGSDKIEP